MNKLPILLVKFSKHQNTLIYIKKTLLDNCNYVFEIKQYKNVIYIIGNNYESFGTFCNKYLCIYHDYNTKIITLLHLLLLQYNIDLICFQNMYKIFGKQQTKFK